MKIIYLLILSLLISFNANAVDIYKCNIDKRTEFAVCGFFNICLSTDTNKEYTTPFVHIYDFESSYTVLVFDDKLIVKRDSDKYEYVLRKRKSNYNFYISKNSISVSTMEGSFVLINNHFYHELSTRNAKIFHSGTCKEK